LLSLFTLFVPRLDQSTIAFLAVVCTVGGVSVAALVSRPDARVLFWIALPVNVAALPLLVFVYSRTTTDALSVVVLAIPVLLNIAALAGLRKARRAGGD
jgi:uncharacterized membrane protein